MSSSASSKFALLVILSFAIEVIPIQLQEGEDIKENNIENSQLNQCINVQRSSGVGECFGKEVLHKLSQYDESDSFSLATGVSFVRDEKAPRDIGSFLDKDPMDFRSMMEDASNLISKRSLHWDLSMVYPGLVMRIAPTLANGVLEFVMDPRIKDRTYHQQPHGEQLSTGRLLARNLLVPFLLGFKFQLSTLLPLILGLVLLASKKAFVLAKVALLAVTLFSKGGGGFGNSFNWGESSPSLSTYTSPYETSHLHGQGHHGLGNGYFHHRHPQHAEYYYKSAETTATPITPDELRDRLESLFITNKKDTINSMTQEEMRQDAKIRNARNFAWTPINTG